MRIKDLIRHFLYGNRASRESYIRYLRSIGVTIGEDVSIYAPMKTLIDESYPWMIRIGNHVRIAEGVKILAHDYSWSVLKRKFNGEILGASGKVDIGDNVFIGMNAIILRGVRIGNNVIIGAGSVVTKDCASDGVYAGNPAVRVCEIEAYYEKRKKAQIKEAKELATEYYAKFGKYPAAEVFHEYFMLFADSNYVECEKWCESKMKRCQNYEQSKEFVANNRSAFRDFDEFMNYCFEDSHK